MPRTTDLLRQMHGRKYGVMTGSGTSALVLALWSLGLHGKRIAIPNGVCYSVPLAVILSGNEPVYLDIDRETLSLGVPELVKYRTWYDAVIAVHNYGARCDIEGIAEFCAKRELPLIEDCCVALGARDIGHWGDVSVFSFGAGKIINLNGLGALLCDDAAVAEAAKYMQHCFGGRQDQDYAGTLSLVHTVLYKMYYRRSRSKLSVFGGLARSVGLKTLWAPAWTDNHGFVCDELKALWRNVAERDQTWSYLRDRLADHVEVFRPPSGSVHWRFNCFVEEGRDELMAHLHDKGYHASSWHAPTDLFFRGTRQAWGPLDGTYEPAGDYIRHIPSVTDWVADHILNLWVDSTVDDDYIEGVSKEVVEWLDTH